MHIMRMQCLKKPEEGIRALETGIRVSLWVLRIELQSSGKAAVLLGEELSLWALFNSS